MVITQTERSIVYEVLSIHFPKQCGQIRDELESAGHYGLVQAAGRFDPNASGATFRTFAWRRVRGAMQDALRTADHLTRTERKRVQAGEREPDCPLVADGDDEMYQVPDLTNDYALVDLKDAIRRAVDGLPARQQFVIRAVYYGEMVLSDVAELFGVSESRVSQIHTQALKSLRAALNGSYAAFMDPLAA